MSKKISDQDKKDWENFLTNEEKLPNKDLTHINKKKLKNKHIDLHGYTLDEANITIEKILDDISFTATDRSGEKIIINKDYINKNLDNLVKDTDLSKFIL